MTDSTVPTGNGLTPQQKVTVGACLLVILCSLAVVFWVLGTYQIRKQGVDALFLVVVCLMFAGAFSLIPLQTMRAAGVLSLGDILLGPADEPAGEAMAHADEEAAEHGDNRFFSIIWIYLLMMTAVEVFLAYVQIFSTGIMIFILMLLSFLKAGLIVAYFMHMKYEKRSLVVSIVPAVVVVMSLLLIAFPDGFRALSLRP